MLSTPASARASTACLDARVGVTQPDGDDELARGDRLERPASTRPLRFGALGEWAEPADRLVASGQLGELFIARRPAAPDVGVVAAISSWQARRAVRHHTIIRSRPRRPCGRRSCRSLVGSDGGPVDVLDDGRQHARVAGRMDAVAEVEDVPWLPTVVGEHGRGTAEGDLGAGEDERRVEVALNGNVGRRGVCGRALIDVRQSSPITRAPAVAIDSRRWSQPMPKWMPGTPGWRSANSVNTRRE